MIYHVYCPRILNFHVELSEVALIYSISAIGNPTEGKQRVSWAFYTKSNGRFAGDTMIATSDVAAIERVWGMFIAAWAEHSGRFLPQH